MPSSPVRGQFPRTALARVVAAFASAAQLVLTGGCASLASEAPTGCDIGSEGCICYANWSCNYLLSCVADVCVDNQSDAADRGTRTTEARLLADDALMSREAPRCMSCAESDCAASLAACYDTSGCAELTGCLLACSRNDGPYFDCSRDCYKRTPFEAYVTANSLHQCLNQACENECYPSSAMSEQ